MEVTLEIFLKAVMITLPFGLFFTVLNTYHLGLKKVIKYIAYGFLGVIGMVALLCISFAWFSFVLKL